MGIEGAGEQVHIFVEFLVLPQVGREPGNRHIGDGKEPIEDDAEVSLQLRFVVGFEVALRAGEKSPVRIIDQVQGQLFVGPIAQAVEELQRPDAPVKHAVTALFVDVFGRVTRQRGDDLDFVRGQKFGEAFVARLQKDGQVAAVNDVPRERQGFDPLDQIPEVANHLRRAARDIYRRDVRARQPVEDPVHRFAAHDFPAFRSGVYVAMVAGEVAEFADIDLKNLGTSMTQLQVVLRKPLSEPVHNDSGFSDGVGQCSRSTACVGRSIPLPAALAKTSPSLNIPLNRFRVLTTEQQEGENSMNANGLLKSMWMLALATSLCGCVIEEHSHSATCGHYYSGGRWYYVPGHVHGPECGHVLRGGIWVTVP